MATANAHIASERLSAFSNMLLASGWTPNELDGEVCYLPPAHIKSIAAAQFGAGHLHVWDALNLQARADLATMEVAA